MENSSYLQHSITSPDATPVRHGSREASAAGHWHPCRIKETREEAHNRRLLQHIMFVRFRGRSLPYSRSTYEKVHSMGEVVCKKGKWERICKLIPLHEALVSALRKLKSIKCM